VKKKPSPKAIGPTRGKSASKKVAVKGKARAS
jgi:hypothetical protein